MIIAIKSCERDRMNGCHDTIRKTWGVDLPKSIPLRFFVGVPDTPVMDWALDSDEIRLGVEDDYNHLAAKTQQICRWATGTNEDFLFLADTDCCVFPNRLQAVKLDFDYAGRFNGGIHQCGPRDLVIKLNEPPAHFPNCHSWASGAGYFLSRKGFTAVAETPDADLYGYAEDVFVGQTIAKHKLEVREMSFSYQSTVAIYYLKDGHSRGYDPKSDWMRQTYESK